MATFEELAARLKSQQAIGRMVGALKAIAAVRWQRVRREYAEAEAYARDARQALADLAAEWPDALPAASEGPVGLVVFTSQRGLVGNFNQLLLAHVQALEGTVIQPDEDPARFSAIRAVYHHFEGFGRSRVVDRRVYPPESVSPTRDGLLLASPARELAHRLYRECVLAALAMAAAQSRASEHSARLRTLIGAEEQIKRMVEESTRAYHQARQERLTRELIEISRPPKPRRHVP